MERGGFNASDTSKKFSDQSIALGLFHRDTEGLRKESGKKKVMKLTEDAFRVTAISSSNIEQRLPVTNAGTLNAPFENLRSLSYVSTNKVTYELTTLQGM